MVKTEWMDRSILIKQEWTKIECMVIWKIPSTKTLPESYRKIGLIENSAKCCYLKKLSCKRILQQVFYLSEPLSPPMTPYPLPPFTHFIRVYSTLIRTGKGGRGGGELTREKVRGTIVHKAGRKYQHDQLYLQSKNSFWVWCLYSYLVYGLHE